MKDVFQIAKCQAQKVAKAEDIELLVHALGSMSQELRDRYLPAKMAIKGTSGTERTNKMDSASRVLVSILTTNRNNLGMLSTDNLGFAGLVPYSIHRCDIKSLERRMEGFRLRKSGWF